MILNYVTFLKSKAWLDRENDYILLFSLLCEKENLQLRYFTPQLTKPDLRNMRAKKKKRQTQDLKKGIFALD